MYSTVGLVRQWGLFGRNTKSWSGRDMYAEHFWLKRQSHRYGLSLYLLVDSLTSWVSKALQMGFQVVGNNLVPLAGLFFVFMTVVVFLS